MDFLDPSIDSEEFGETMEQRMGASRMPIPGSANLGEARSAGAAAARVRAAAAAGGIDLEYARMAQKQRDEMRAAEEAEERMKKRCFLVTELQRNWSGGPRVPAKIR